MQTRILTSNTSSLSIGSRALSSATAQGSCRSTVDVSLLAAAHRQAFEGSCGAASLHLCTSQGHTSRLRAALRVCSTGSGFISSMQESSASYLLAPRMLPCHLPSGGRYALEQVCCSLSYTHFLHKPTGAGAYIEGVYRPLGACKLVGEDVSKLAWPLTQMCIHSGAKFQDLDSGAWPGHC